MCVCIIDRTVTANARACRLRCVRRRAYPWRPSRRSRKAVWPGHDTLACERERGWKMAGQANRWNNKTGKEGPGAVPAKRFAGLSAIFFLQPGVSYQNWRPYPTEVVSRLFDGHPFSTMAVFKLIRRFSGFKRPSFPGKICSHPSSMFFLYYYVKHLNKKIAI